MQVLGRRRGSLVAALVAVALAGCGEAAGPVAAQAPPETVLLPAGTAAAADPAELLPEPAALGASWRVVDQAPARVDDGCSRAGAALTVPATAVRTVLTDGTVVAEVSAWSATEPEVAATAASVLSGALDPPRPECPTTTRVADYAMGPTAAPGEQLDDDRATDALVRVEHVAAGDQVVATEFLLAVQRGPVVVVAQLHGGVPHGQHTATFAAQQAVNAVACAAPARPGCEGPDSVGAGLLAPAALGPDWTAGLAPLPERRSSLFCNGVGGYGFSGGSIDSARRQFSGPGGATAFQGVLADVDAETSASLRAAAADEGAHTSMACAEEPERDEQMLVDEVDEQAGTWERAFRVTETLASGESATAVLLGVGRGPVVGLLTVRDDGADVDHARLLAALRTGVCAVPTAAGC